MLWLADDEIAAFTGYQRAGDQVRWLERNGFVERADFFLTAAGKPRLLRAALDRKQLISLPTVRASEPDFGAVR